MRPSLPETSPRYGTVYRPCGVISRVSGSSMGPYLPLSLTRGRPFRRRLYFIDCDPYIRRLLGMSPCIFRVALIYFRSPTDPAKSTAPEWVPGRPSPYWRSPSGRLACSVRGHSPMFGRTIVFVTECDRCDKSDFDASPRTPYPNLARDHPARSGPFLISKYHVSGLYQSPARRGGARKTNIAIQTPVESYGEFRYSLFIESPSYDLRGRTP